MMKSYGKKVESRVKGIEWTVEVVGQLAVLKEALKLGFIERERAESRPEDTELARWISGGRGFYKANS